MSDANKGPGPNPVFMDISNMVYGYDYQQGPVPEHAFQAPWTGGEQLGALQVREQPPEPPHANPGPAGYPWEGHPVSTPLLGPGGTSPMRRGGPNLPAYAPAPERPRDYTGQVYPYNTPGSSWPNAGQVPMGPQAGPAGFAGVDLAGLDTYFQEAEMAGWFDEWRAGSEERQLARQEKRETRRTERQARRDAKSRDAPGSGGWVYRQFRNGDILILDAPHSAQEWVGQRITEESDYSRWAAITNEIGTFSGSRQAATASVLSRVADLLSPKPKTKKKKRRRPSGQEGSDEPSTEEETDFPWIPVIIVGTLIVGLGATAYRRRQSYDD